MGQIFYSTYSDNFISRGAGVSWNDTVTGSGTGLGAPSSPLLDILAKDDGVSGTRYAVIRPILIFDTSTVGATPISAGRIKIYVVNIVGVVKSGNDFLTVVQAVRNNPGTEVNFVDYQNCGVPVVNPSEGIDVGNRVDITNIDTGLNHDYLTFELNATGLSWVNPSGFTEFSIREGHDVLNSAITVDTVGNLVEFWSSTGSSNQRPYLELDTVGSKPMIFSSRTNTFPFIFHSISNAAPFIFSSRT